MNWDKLELLKSANLQAIGYVPLPLQVPIHLSRERVILISGGEGSGKSYVTAAEIVARYPLWRLCYVVGPKYEAAHKEVDYVYESLLKIGATRKDLYQRPSRGKIVLATVDGARVETLSAEDGPKAITGTGESPELLAMVEAGKQSYEIYLACRARIARSRGTLILSGTIEEAERWYPELITRWQADNPEGGRSFILPTWSNTRLYPGGFNDPEIKALAAAYQCDISNGIAEPTPDVNDQSPFWERFGARPVTPPTIVLKEFSHVRHVKNAPYWANDPDWKDLPVEVWIDPGGDGHYAVLAVQVLGHTVWVIDEVCVEFGLATDIINICEGRAWWQNVPKIGNVKGQIGGVMDIAGKSRDGRESHEDIWRREARVTLGASRVAVDDGIQQHRAWLKGGFGAALLHDPRCKYTLKEYGLYKRHPDTGAVIDKDNHAMKALAYGLVYHFGLGEQTQEPLRSREEVEVLDPMMSMFKRG